MCAGWMTSKKPGERASTHRCTCGSPRWPRYTAPSVPTPRSARCTSALAPRLAHSPAQLRKQGSENPTQPNHRNQTTSVRTWCGLTAQNEKGVWAHSSERARVRLSDTATGHALPMADGTVTALQLKAPTWSTSVEHQRGAPAWSTNLSTSLEHQLGAPAWSTNLEHQLGAPTWSCAAQTGCKLPQRSYKTSSTGAPSK
jgi:hypothetical protein